MPNLCTREDVEVLYGDDNLAQWADLNNTGRGDGGATDEVIDARIDAVIADESEIFTDMMRNHTIKLPLPDPVPRFIVRIVAINVGITLHSGRGIDEENPVIQARAKESRDKTKAILSGQVRLNSTVSHAPSRPGLPYEA